jgi:nitrogen fixation NifU-like protein
MPPSDADPAPLTALYQELILDHYRRPRNHGRLEKPDVAIVKRNPLCGDEIELQLAFEGETVRDIRFAGQGCAISQASASMMTQLLKGRSASEIGRVAERFAQMVSGDSEAARDRALGDLRALAGVAKVPVRQKCALLAWTALAEALATPR